MIELNKQEKVSEFISFCIENFKLKHSMKGKEVTNLFKEASVFEFLINGYEMLHTQGRDYIISEIDVFLKNRGYEI